MVLVIISILAGMLLPAISTALSNARKVVCINNLKQIQLAGSHYEADYGFYPLHYLPNSVTTVMPPLPLFGSDGFMSAYLNDQIEITRCPEVSGYYNDLIPVISYGTSWWKWGAGTPQGVLFLGIVDGIASRIPLYGDSGSVFFCFFVEQNTILTPLFGSGVAPDMNHFGDINTNTNVSFPDVVALMAGINRFTVRHQNRGHRVFLDGHVKADLPPIP